MIDIFGKSKKELASKEAAIESLTKELEEVKASVKDNSELKADRDNIFNELQALKEKEATFEEGIADLKDAHSKELEAIKADLSKAQFELASMKDAHAKELEAVTATQQQQVVEESIRLVASQGLNTPDIKTISNDVSELTEKPASARFKIKVHKQQQANV